MTRTSRHGLFVAQKITADINRDQQMFLNPYKAAAMQRAAGSGQRAAGSGQRIIFAPINPCI
ncbi:hypothetical protein C3402_01190 [Pantoea sp. PSNIH3]|nr:hypothetical protein PSNIH2_01505 [Pantoea sp. PSNIH2]POU52209.1 hypothetical protein C3380_01190 [Pantoea sp. PSNIH5]POY69799.1 hypothetical protein C3402_01190 [Pantoea sp. PSNIH3]